jgi:lipopolysaccharide transport system ATP-binding protein
MNEVARSGRTVVFVSHNLSSIERLCTRAVLLRRGRAERVGGVRDVVSAYLASGSSVSLIDLRAFPERVGEGRARITGVELRSSDGLNGIDVLTFREPFRVRISYEVFDPMAGASFAFAMLTDRGDRVFLSQSYEFGKTFNLEPGSGSVDCAVLAPNLVPGVYRFELWISVPGLDPTDHLPSVGEVQMTVDQSSNVNMASLTKAARGPVFLECDWRLGSAE